MKRFCRLPLLSAASLLLVAVALAVAALPLRAQRAGTMREARLSAAEKRRLNTFFSNFSEVDTAPFAQGKVPHETLVKFACLHNWRNDTGRPRSAPQGSGYSLRIPASEIERCAARYFGVKTVKHRSVPQYPYRGGWYYFEVGEGDGIAFSQVTRIWNRVGGLYEAHVNVYLPPNDWEGDVHAAPSTWRPTEMGTVELVSRMRATIRKVAEGGASRYVLVSYTEVK